MGGAEDRGRVEGRVIRWAADERGEGGQGIVVMVTTSVDNVHYVVARDGGGTHEVRVNADEWYWVAANGVNGAASGGARVDGTVMQGALQARGAGSVTGTAPAGVTDIWGGRRPEMRTTGMMRARARMVGGLEQMLRVTTEAERVGGQRSKIVRLALSGMRTEAIGRPMTATMQESLREVVGALLPPVTWRTMAGRETAQARYKKDVRARTESAMAAVQIAAAGVIAAWARKMNAAHWWTSARERMHVRARTVLGAWREVARRGRTWGGTTRLWREAGGSGPEWLIPRENEALAEWSERGCRTAVWPGSVGAWLLWHARSTSGQRVESRRRYAAWRVRAERGQDMWKRYEEHVRAGMRPVAVRSRPQWRARCEAEPGKSERTWEGTAVRRKRGTNEIEVIGGDTGDRTVRRRQFHQAVVTDGETVEASARDMGRGVQRGGHGRGGRGGGRGSAGRGGGEVMARTTAGLWVRMAWVMDKRWWRVGDTMGDTAVVETGELASDDDSGGWGQTEMEENDEQNTWEATAAREDEAEREWEDEYYRNVVEEEDIRMGDDAYGDG